MFAAQRKIVRWAAQPKEYGQIKKSPASHDPPRRCRCAREAPMSPTFAASMLAGDAGPAAGGRGREIGHGCSAWHRGGVIAPHEGALSPPNTRKGPMHDSCMGWRVDSHPARGVWRQSPARHTNTPHCRGAVRIIRAACSRSARWLQKAFAPVQSASASLPPGFVGSLATECTVSLPDSSTASGCREHVGIASHVCRR